MTETHSPHRYTHTYSSINVDTIYFLDTEQTGACWVSESIFILNFSKV